ncbi:MAG: hypothetical protein CMF48_04840 [Legionellales bacterium]|nr:hypothetical protein [Legionellales bacterium]|tara:strand:- start:841 stop:1785 length:945 start_codon:yes stop_codon:yes gene_type:complete
MSRILITGSTGFVGKHLIKRLIGSNDQCVLAVSAIDPDITLEQIVVPRLNENIDWAEALSGCDTVIHLAARVHQMSENPEKSESIYDEINHLATKNLASQSAASGVKRFVYISSIKVLGESSSELWHPDSPAKPVCAYGRSKLKAEQAVEKIGRSTLMEWVIIRPPLVYGPGAKGNFPKIIKLIKRAPVLPLGGIKNVRGMVSVDNLCDLIVTCCHHPAAKNQIFHVQDNSNCSTSQFLKDCAEAMSCRLKLFYLPKMLIQGLAKIVRKEGIVLRLWGSLGVDDNKTREVLNWHEPVSYKTALKSAIESVEDKH